TRQDGCRNGQSHPPRHPPRHLRRARRRSQHHRVLPQRRSRLRVLLSLPCAHCTPRGSTGKHQESPQVIARDSTKDKKPAATRALSLPVLPRKETAERK